MNKLKTNIKLVIFAFISVILAFCAISVITNTFAEENSKPNIVIDYGEYKQGEVITVPYGVVGSPYTIFDAIVTDEKDTEPSLTVKVFRDYASQHISVKVINNTFIPEKAVTHTIEYTATNRYGVSYVVTVNVSVLSNDKVSPIEISASNVTDAKQGYPFEIPTPTVVGDNRLGSISVTNKIFYNGQELELNGNSFIPMYSGNYTLQYIAKDYAGREKVLEKTVSVSHTEELLVFDNIENFIPKFLVQDNLYSLPQLKVYEFGTDSYTENLCTINVNGTEVQNLKYKANVPSDKCQMSIVYSYKTYSETYDVIGVKARDGVLDTTKLFVPFNDATVSYDSGVKLTFKSSSDYVEFSNPLSVENLSLTFATYKSLATNVLISMTDMYKPQEKISFNLTESSMYINSVKKDIVAFFDGSENSLIVENNIVSIGGKDFTIDTYENGEAFNGFSSGFVYLTLSLSGIKGDSATLTASYLNDNFFYQSEDKIKPNIIFLSVYNSVRSIGDTLVTPKVKGVDVIDGMLDCFVTVTYKNKAVKDVNGITVENLPAEQSYNINLDKYGSYKIVYKTVDYSNKSTTVTRFVTVIDEVRPEINLKGSVPTSGTVNSSVKLPSATATDNVSYQEDMEVYIVVISPNQVYTHVENNNFVPDSKGRWTVRYYVFDDAGNMSYKDFTVNVK